MFFNGEHLKMNTFKKSALAIAVMAVGGFTQVAHAAVDANFGVTSNYLWRGASQSADGPSISGGIDYSNDNGFYAGTWVGSIDWGVGGSENDYYLGYSGESGDFGYDVGYLYYAYPSSGYEDSDFGEIYFNGSYGDFGFGIAYTVNSEASDDAAWNTGDMYYSVSYAFALPEDYSVSITAGFYDFDADSDLVMEISGVDDYAHVQIDIAKGDFTFSLSKAEEESGNDDTKFVVSWGASF
jgi:uncharacterized protein (TIGR02001 family)